MDAATTFSIVTIALPTPRRQTQRPKIQSTREMIREVVGMVSGNGFTAKTKPESYGAFVVADKHT